jgi:cell division transport system ATP-binding protein
MEGSATPPAALVSFDRVCKRFGAKLVLSDLNFEVARNELVVLLGPSGAGKTTILRLIAALERPSSGNISIGGEPLHRVARHAMAHLRRSIGVVPQDLLLLNDRSILDNVALPAFAAGLTSREARERAITALQHVGLAAAEAAAMPQSLSRSARQRAALARALVHRPALLLLDEPMAHLDHASAAAVMRLLEQCVAGGVTVIATSDGGAARQPEGARLIAIQPQP